MINAVHPSASVSGNLRRLGVNIVIAMQAAICAEARLADSVIINTAAVVDHECVVETGAHICPGVHLAGRVRVGACAFVGIGANVIQCLSIGEHAVIGAGAVVTSDVADGATAVGVPTPDKEPKIRGEVIPRNRRLRLGESATAVYRFLTSAYNGKPIRKAAGGSFQTGSNAINRVRIRLCCLLFYLLPPGPCPRPAGLFP